MFTLICIVLAGAAGFVGGVLVGRNNKKSIDTVMTGIKDIETRLK